ncbi:MAG: DDRRRQL repeat protein YjdP [Scandinavium sp.]|uniref:DDRRRQL repeat protein YjdP n=1 Tax=Scandinavium sp. TaxID=2830653 RepID=UPI003F2BAF29
MKRTTLALLICTLPLMSQMARADIIDDAIGNIQQAISDAYKPNSDHVYHDDRDDSDNADDNRQQDTTRSRQYDDRYRQLEDRHHQLDDRQRQLDQERRQLDDEERRLQDEYDR